MRQEHKLEDKELSRFRWTTIQRALDALAAEKTNAEVVALFEELGYGPRIDGLSGADSTTPKLRNVLSRLAREDGATDTEGVPLSDRLVQEAAQTVPDLKQAPWGPPMEHRKHHEAFLRSLAVDGWTVRAGRLLPDTPVSLSAARTRLRASLELLGANEAAARLDQVESGLDDAHWESANGDIRTFLNSVFEAVAARWPATTGQGLREGDARAALQRTGFFKMNPGETTKSLEADMIRAMLSFFGSEGSHTGASDAETSSYRYALAVLTADHFIQRVTSD